MPATQYETPHIGHLHPMVGRPSETLVAEVPKTPGVIMMVVYNSALASVDLTKEGAVRMGIGNW